MAIPKPYLTSFCCCIGVEMGAKIVGILHLLVAFSLLIMCSVYASKFGEVRDTVEDAGDHLYSTWHKAAIGMAVVSSAHMVLAATLLYGVCKRNILALRVWVITMCVLVVASLVVNLAFSLVGGINATGSDMFVSLLELLLFFGFIMYCIVTVYSYYLMVGSCRDNDCDPTNY